MAYTANDRQSRYTAFITSFTARVGRAFFNASYTRSASGDDAGIYPSAYNPNTFYGLSSWDAPNRFSFAGNYQIPGYQNGHGILGRVLTGWSLSGIAIVQSGYPFTVFTNAVFVPIKNATGQFVGYAPGSGDFNADGDNNDYPDVVSYTQNTTRQGFLNGTVSKSNFTLPAFGTEGNEKTYQFRNPMFSQIDASSRKIPLLPRA